MTTVHRFFGTVTKPCEERFGGVARCALPYVNGLHYSDDRHPFTLDSSIGCGWRAQVGRTAGDRCGLFVTSPVHVAEGDWRCGLVRPPDEDAEARSVEGVKTTEQVSFAGARLGPMKAVSRRPWEVAIEALGASRASVLNGPWSVRQFRIADDVGVVDDGEAFLKCLESLTVLGMEWEMSTERVGGARWALVTWGEYRGLSRGVVADEIASAYDEG